VRHALNRSRQVARFHTPAALDELLTRDFEAELAALAAVPQNDRLRPYQVEANAAVELGITDRKRKMLVTMATAPARH
jgi:type I restriction enzyme, R subunit